MKEVVIVSAVRTPIGSFMGGLSTMPAPRLGAIAIEGALKKINLDPALVNEVIMGNVVQAGTGQAPARQAAIFAGIPNTVPCTTINKVCASGMKAVMQGAQAIALGDADIVIAGGMENMSLIPHYVQMRTGTKFGPSTLIDGMQKDGLVDAYDENAMGVCADACALKYNFSREDQDAYAIQSYTRSSKAWEAGKFDNEVIPVAVPQRRGEPKMITKDEEFTNVFIDKIPNLRPAFSKDGTVTAANALAKSNLSIEDIEFFEFNEAFSVVGLANMKLLGLSDSNVNVNGGAVSLGHPLGCSGARILITLMNVLEQNNAKLGAAAICNGGGGASAIIIERV